MKVKEPAADKRARFDAALAEAHGDSKTEATTPRKRAKKAVAGKPERAAEAEKSAESEAGKAEKPAKTAAERPAKTDADEAGEASTEA
jgi:small subunit ribosomal protein S16